MSRVYFFNQSKFSTMKKVSMITMIVCLISTSIIIPKSHAQNDTLRVMVYNLLQFSSSSQSRADDYLKDIIKYTKPDVFLVNEVTSSSAANYILTNALNIDGVSTYDKATFTGSSSLKNMMYYNTDKLIFIDQDIIATSPRQTDGYTFYYNDPGLSYGQDTVFMSIYVTHLKAGSSPSDESQRASAAATIRSYVDSKPNIQNHFIVGDFNLYSSSEQAYQNLIASGNCQFLDPINTPGSWHASSGYAEIHTQSTRTTSFGGGATGGLDDRFDFILCTEDVLDGSNHLEYVPNSYSAIGNDGNHYNTSLIASPVNSVFPDSIVQDLYYMSDHLPVLADFEISLPIVSPDPCSELFFSEYIEGSLSNRALELSNPTDIDVNLNNYELHFYPDGTSQLPAYRQIALSGIIPANDSYVLSADGAGTGISSQSDLVVSQLDSLMTGNDAVVLFNTVSQQAIDVIGEIGTNPGSNGWIVGAGSTTDHTLVRETYVTNGTTIWSQSAFNWQVLAQDNTDSLGSATLLCQSSSEGACSKLFFSEYFKGSGIYKALEIYNPSPNPVVFQGDYSIRVFNNGTTGYYELILSGQVIQPNDVLVITNQYTSLPGITANADVIESSFPGVTFFTGDDAVVLFQGTDTLDIIGVVGQDPGSHWSVSGTNGVNGNTGSYTLVRDPSVHEGQTDWSVASQHEWIVLPLNDDSNIGSHTMSSCETSYNIESLLLNLNLWTDTVYLSNIEF